MKLILCTIFCCNIAYASRDGWDECGKTPTGSSNELGQIFRYETAANEQDATTEEEEPTEEESPTVTAAEQEPLTDEHNQSATHSVVNITLPKKIEEPDSNDKNPRANLGFLSKYPFLKKYKFVIPCVTVITYLAYRWRR